MMLSSVMFLKWFKALSYRNIRATINVLKEGFAGRSNVFY